MTPTRPSRTAALSLLPLAVLAVSFEACKRREPIQASPVGVGAGGSSATSAPAAPSSRSAPARRGKKGGTDVTFCVVSDTHFGFGDIAKENETLVGKLNALTPAPRGLVVTGDLTEWGKTEEWEPFVATYGHTGTEGKLHIPVFEMIGNHDKVHGPWVEQQVSKRHGGRFYAWDWDDVHLVALGEAPDDEGLAFLKQDLERIEPRVPLFLFFHLALEGPWSTGHWFGDGDYKGRLAKLLEGRFVAAIFHGHHHATGHYMWNGIDVFKPGAVKGGAHTFALVHVTDERVTVESRDWDHDRAAAPFAKSIPR